MWTPGVEEFFTKSGYEVGKGDSWNSNGNTYYTLDMNDVDDPVKATIDYIDNFGFGYTRDGKYIQRWSHTNIPKYAWDKMSNNQKRKIVKEMYDKERAGNKVALLNKYFA